MTRMNANAEIDIEIQIESDHRAIPKKEDLIKWAVAALETKQAEITIRIVDEEESSQLNQEYRHKPGPTNVLSFSFNDHFHPILEGDIVICAPLVWKEAIAQEKPFQNHWAHLTIHGILHLQGYDHIQDKNAQIMEEKEIKILANFNIPSPY